MFLTALAAALALAIPAYAAFPGANGRIIVAGGCNMWSITDDGSVFQQLTFDPCPGPNPPREVESSPDGTKIAYTRGPDVFVMNADGTGETNITAALNAPGVAWEYSPDWSPDGTRIAFTQGVDAPGDGATQHHVLVANADGTNAVPLETSMCDSRIALWNPGGQRIALFGSTTPGAGSCISHKWFTINADGTDLQELPTEGMAEWMPDGQYVVFAGVFDNSPQFVKQRADGSSPPEDLFPGTANAADGIMPVMSPDGTRILFKDGRPPTQALKMVTAEGTGKTIVWESPAFDYDWAPIPINAYPRPRAASPQHISLVPAYQPCTSANRTHGPPLAFGSCAPPQREPGQLTVGTPDSNGKPAKNVGELWISVTLGIPSTPADEADVRLYGQVTDVRLASDLSDYTGTLEARVNLRITDKDNTPHPGGPGAATVEDLTYTFPIPCTATADTTVGSACPFDTTAEALLPGAVKEGRRAIWELGQLSVHDGGGDVFLRQGVLIP